MCLVEECDSAEVRDERSETGYEPAVEIVAEEEDAVNIPSRRCHTFLRKNYKVKA